MSTRLQVSAVPVDVTIGDLDGNLHRLRRALATTRQSGPHLVVLPELATSGYVFGDRREAWELALTADDARLTSLAAELAPETVAVVGFCERDGDALYNSAVVLGHNEIFGRYRKSHLWAAECTMFAAGPEAGTVIDTPICRLGVVICYDNEFPELPRRLALAGAEVLALPVNWPLVDRPAGEHPPEVVQAMGAARSSRLATVIADRHGSERGVTWTGGTCVISSDGWLVATGDAARPATALLELPADKSLGEFNDLFADRRPELYGDIAVPRTPVRLPIS
ncbi:carbon-nitrogen hydrolase [Mycolicibacterium litorale]|nr:carbon-nitrogen hydrolase [Mycolicibacterium litorale]